VCGEDAGADSGKTFDGKKHMDRFYKAEDKAAEREVGDVFAAAWSLAHKHIGNESHYDGLLTDAPGNAPAKVRYIFELKNRNVACNGEMVTANGKHYPTLPLSKMKVENLYAESVRRGVPALVVFRAKDDGGIWWVDVARCVNLKVFPNSGRTKTPMCASDIEDCVYIPITWFTPRTTVYATGDDYRYGIPYRRVHATMDHGEYK
jgi:hypothetical protein